MKGIEKAVQFGDVLNVAGQDYTGLNVFQKIGFWIVEKIILWDQKRTFGPKSNYLDHHSQMYIGNNQVWSCEPPKPLIKPLEKCLNPYETISVYRYQKKDFDSWDQAVIMGMVNTILNWDTPYSIGLLVDDLIASIAGYPASPFRIFAPSRKDLVCSVGCATIMHGWRHKLWDVKHFDLPRLFGKLNESMWSKDFIRKWPGYFPVDRTPPAIFANSNIFDNEYKFIGSFINGEAVC